MEKNDFVNDYGMLNAKRADINAENAPLWSLEWCLLSGDLDMLTNIENYIHKCKTDVEGLYHQLPESEVHEDSHDAYMSPDQLIAFVGALFVLGRAKQIKEIWRYLLKHFFTYDNLTGKINFSRIMQPAAVLFVGACAGNKLCKALLVPVILWSVKAKPTQTSGRLKAWTMFKTLKMKLTEKVANYVISKNDNFKNWAAVFKTYFYEEGHPIPEYIERNDV